jgi:Kef-type K+ transport system membrane component KefB
MNELTSLGVILLLALAAGHIVKWLRVPEVTGYLLAGIALGPSAMGWVSADNLAALEVLSEVALGLILFSIGTIFEFDRFRKIGPQLYRIVLFEAVLTAAVVYTALFMFGQPWQVSLMLGILAMETAAASTLMVMREYNARGPVTELLSGVFALDNLLCLFAFTAATGMIKLSQSSGSGIYEVVFPVVWQIVGGAAVGYMIGFLISLWSPRVLEHGEQLILLAGCVLLGVGIAKALNLSSMVTNLAVGATLVNLSPHTRRLFNSLSQTDPPLYAIFFVIAGADLDLSLLRNVGLAGVVYVAMRLIGKFAGSTIGARVARLDKAIADRLRWGMFAQAGLTVGLTLVLGQRLPDFAPTVTTIALSAVIIFEILGPLSVRWTLLRGGEVHHEEEEQYTGILE